MSVLFRSRGNSLLCPGLACQLRWMKIEPGCERGHPAGLRQPDPCLVCLDSHLIHPHCVGKGSSHGLRPQTQHHPLAWMHTWTCHGMKLSCFGTSWITHHFCIQKYFLGAYDGPSSLPHPGPLCQRRQTRMPPVLKLTF